jgi:hypothetical protein
MAAEGVAVTSSVSTSKERELLDAIPALGGEGKS